MFRDGGWVGDPGHYHERYVER
eukprot:COSAG06_NODE_49336_length_326_cov_0.682819_1_plen_21_part_10